MADRFSLLPSAARLRGASPLWRADFRAAFRLAWHWLYGRRESLLVGAILLVTALAHGINMFHFPYYETDEGTYMSQAWAVVREARLAPYTYIYDHAPGGWLQIAGWVALTGGFERFGNTVESGRVLMLLFQVGSTLALYRIARSLTGSIAIATITTLLFALSAYGLLYHRRVLLDNIATFWMLIAVLALVSGRLSLGRVWLSAVALGISILSKEITLFLIPALALLTYHRAHRTQRAFATLGWLALVVSIFSGYLLLAILKNELFPPNYHAVGSIVFGGTDPHVSLIETLRWQAGRNKDAGLLDLGSKFWQVARVWLRDEPLLVVGGTVAAFVGVLLIRRERDAGILGLATCSLWLFLCRGGETLNFYLLPLLPLLALNIGFVLAILTRRWVVTGGGERARALGARLLRLGARPALAVLCLPGLLAGYSSPNLGVESRPTANSRSALGTLPWEGDQAIAQQQAVDWIRRNIAPDAAIIIDNYAWTDLHDTAGGDPSYERAHWYWKVQQDDTIKNGVFYNDWRYADYVITTSQLLTDTAVNGLTLVDDVVKHSSLVVRFNTGGWPVEVRRVDKFHQWAATRDPLLDRSWGDYRARFIENGRAFDPRSDGQTTAERQSQALLRAVYMDDRQTFGTLWAWTKANLRPTPDGLLAWRWGRRPDGSSGILDPRGATDADQDTTLALLFASRRWNVPDYEAEARVMMASIWDRETIVVGSRRFVAAGSWATSGERPIVNPSYLAPHVYHVFAAADPARPWRDLVDSSYDLLAQIAQDPALGGTSGIVPNWIALDPVTGVPGPASALGSRAGEFSYDASRLPFRLMLDWLWFQDNRAKEASAALDLPRRELARTAAGTGLWLAASYRPDGTPATNDEAMSMYAGSFPGLLFTDRPLALRVYGEKILGTYGVGPSWGDPGSIDDQNWGWYATALLDGSLGNLWAGQAVVRFDEVLP